MRQAMLQLRGTCRTVTENQARVGRRTQIITAEAVHFYSSAQQFLRDAFQIEAGVGAGTQMHAIPDTTVPLVADMSSDILSRPMDYNRFDLIYAGAQKNAGAAGVNLVIVKKDILGKVSRKIPSMMDYRIHIDNGSMLNTPPVFAVYVCMLTLRWLKKQGGVPAVAKLNEEKTSLLYETLDALPLFTPKVAREDRSMMNVVWIMKDAALEKEFLAACKEHGMVGIKGHRTVGGFRASLYNALSIDSVRALTDLMKDFANKKG